MNRLITLTFQFYRPILLWNCLCSGLGLWFVIKYGLSTTGNSLGIKIMGYIISFGYQYFMANKTYFYFRNAGYSIKRLYAYTFLADVSVYFLLVLLYAFVVHGYEYLKS